MNNALANPPSSTEQILHPKKFLQSPRDEPLLVGLPPLTDTLGTGWVFKDTQKIGEFELGVLLSTNGVPTTDAEAASSAAAIAFNALFFCSVLSIERAWQDALASKASLAMALMRETSSRTFPLSRFDEGYPSSCLKPA